MLIIEFLFAGYQKYKIRKYKNEFLMFNGKTKHGTNVYSNLLSYLLCRNRGLLMEQAVEEVRPSRANVKTASSQYLIFINYIHPHKEFSKKSK